MLYTALSCLLQFILLVVGMFDRQAPDIKVVADSGDDIILQTISISMATTKIQLATKLPYTPIDKPRQDDTNAI